MTRHVAALKIRPEDNVSVVLTAGGLDTGALLDDGTTLVDPVPFGHKVALCDIPADGAITRYGVTIGFATEALRRGAWVNEHRIRLPEAPALDALPRPAPVVPAQPLDGYSFEGYRNPDGSVGTRNILAISTSVQCVAGVVDQVVARIKAELLPRYRNVDDVVGLTHAFGCGVAINANGAEIPIRTVQNLARNPNFGGEVMVIGLGCEKLRPEWLLPEGDPNASLLTLQDPELTGYAAMVEAILAQAEGHLKRLDRRRRETCPASELVVGVQCGGSDAFSGVTANPVIGAAADLVVRAGGSVMFSEVTEVRDAVHLLAPRCIDDEVAAALAREMSWYDAYLARGGADRSANTTPGNKAGGLSGIVEKALGSVAKSGTSPLADVTGPGERLRRRGLSFAATPAGDFVCGTLQLAAGMNLHLFSTGRGTPYNIPGAPTLKIATNSDLARRWFDLIDLDAGRAITEGAAIDALGRELFELILEVASGRVRTAADRLGIHNDLVLFNPAPVT